MESPNSKISDDELIDILRRAASIWFKNQDLLFLEEFIKRFNRRKGSHSGKSSEPSIR